MIEIEAMQQFIDDAVTQLEEIEGTTTWPPASELDIARAEKDLGVRFSDDHRALLRRTNGLSLAHGRLRMFGVGPSAPVDLVWFNNPDTWRWAWRDRPDLHDLVWCGIHDQPYLLGFRRAELTQADGVKQFHGGPIDLAGHVEGEYSLAEFLDGRWQGMARSFGRDKILSQFIDHFGPIPVDHAVVPGPQYFFPPYDETREHEGAVVLPMDQALINFHDLLASTEEIEARPDFEQLMIVGATTRPDDKGRPRLHWVTDRETV